MGWIPDRKGGYHGQMIRETMPTSEPDERRDAGETVPMWWHERQSG